MPLPAKWDFYCYIYFASHPNSYCIIRIIKNAIKGESTNSNFLKARTPLCNNKIFLLHVQQEFYREDIFIAKQTLYP